jgi:hypothetical protein
MIFSTRQREKRTLGCAHGEYCHRKLTQIGTAVTLGVNMGRNGVLYVERVVEKERCAGGGKMCIRRETSDKKKRAHTLQG